MWRTRCEKANQSLLKTAEEVGIELPTTAYPYVHIVCLVCGEGQDCSDGTS